MNVRVRRDGGLLRPFATSTLCAHGNRNAWPNPAFRKPPAIDQAARLAWLIRRNVLGRRRVADPLLRFDGVCRVGGFSIRQARLLPEQGGKQALLIPKPGDRFDICVDPTPSAGWGSTPAAIRKELHEHRFRFLVGHELGHSFFFARTGDQPRRSRRAGRAEENFCDEFARWLLIPPTVASGMPLSAETIFRLHSRYRVSVELAARAVAAARPSEAQIAIGLVGRDGSITPQWVSPMASTALLERPARDVVSCRRRTGALALANGGTLEYEAVYRPERRQVVLVADSPGS